MHGWIPATVQVVAGLTLLGAIGWRSRRWRLVWVPWAALCGVALAVAVYAYVASEGFSDNPAPHSLWVWVALSGAACVVLVAGWRGARWRRRCASLTALPLCLLSAALVVNLWVGYVPTVPAAWNQLTAGPLPDQTDATTMLAMQERHQIPARGTVVPVDTGDKASGFRHRSELVYLPPAWYATDPPPPLPTVMMIGGEFNTPADWIRAGDAVTTADAFAAVHGGYAPVLVFVDAGGTFRNDTECVNGSRGNAADHLTKDVVPLMISTFKVSPRPANWGVAGFSMGGTCAVDLAVMHPDMFSAFDDIAGDLSPNSGTKVQTIDRLFGGSAAAYSAFDPMTVMNRHGRYSGLTGRFDVNTVNAGPQKNAADTLCRTATADGIDCSVVVQPGMHDWPYAAHAFAAALPWLAARIGTPGRIAPVSDVAVRQPPPRGRRP
ncbi:alpha/beta hydrolase [Mycolicibacterium celeriflavum]|uniref:alpha/beta hydrolase n=1 Tax=Mycolicibacterium celeriflavum TaxID=1249101 RepID=UPI003CF32E6C